MNILYHLPSKEFNLSRGSGKRPYEMSQAFKNLGHDVEIIHGDRLARLKESFGEKIRKEYYDFCYSEPPTSPIHPLYDYAFFFQLWRHNIPTAVFYRDVYWKFPDLFTKSGIEKQAFRAAHYTECEIYSKLADIVYFPSEFTSEISFSASETATLPPGCNPVKPAIGKDINEVIYVGGISERYGITNLIKMMDILNGSGISLNLVCRQTEYNNLSGEQKKMIRKLPINILHCSGDELIPIYESADIGIIPLRDTYYNNMAMPVKLFEYISFGLPIISTDCKKISDFIQESDCGRICRDDPNELADEVTYLVSNPKVAKEMAKSSHTTAKQNTWKQRAKKVCDRFS